MTKPLTKAPQLNF